MEWTFSNVYLFKQCEIIQQIQQKSSKNQLKKKCQIGRNTPRSENNPRSENSQRSENCQRSEKGVIAWPFADFTDVSLADKDNNAIPTDDANREILGNLVLQVMPPGGQNWN